MPDSGHAQVAHALSQILAASGRWRPVEDNVIRYFPRSGPLFMKFYKWMLFHWAGLWGHLHDNADYAQLVRAWEAWFYKMDFFHLEKMLGRHKPDAVLVTHALPLRSLAALRAKGRLSLPLFALTTDFWAHRYWAHKTVDHYFASSLQARSDLIRNGVARQKISITGIPVREQFLRPIKKERVLKSLKFNPHKKTIFVLGGSYGVLPYQELLEAAIADAGLSRHQWIFVFGNNKKGLAQARNRLSGKSWGNIRVFGFTQEVPKFMVASDLMIGKAGALSSSEALVMGLPMVITRPMPGQEIKNAAFLASSGAAVREDNTEKLIGVTRRILDNPGRLESMRLAAKRLAHPHAGGAVLKILDDWMKRKI